MRTYVLWYMMPRQLGNIELCLKGAFCFNIQGKSTTTRDFFLKKLSFSRNVGKYLPVQRAHIPEGWNLHRHRCDNHRCRNDRDGS